jgi:hypothetical protein
METQSKEARKEQLEMWITEKEKAQAFLVEKRIELYEWYNQHKMRIPAMTPILNNFDFAINELAREIEIYKEELDYGNQ